MKIWKYIRYRKFLVFALIFLGLLSILTSLNISGYIPGIVLMPMRCASSYVIVTEGDVGTPVEMQECYSPFHAEFWKNKQPIEFQWIFSVQKGWYWGEHSEKITSLKQVLIHPSYPADFSDNTILMGAAHEVVIGKVLAQVSANDFVGNPATQYSVEIIKTIKGDEKKGTIIVNQEGGYKDNTLYLMEDSIGLLQPGSTYLLATRYDPELDFYTLNPHPNASKLLTSDMTASIGALKKLADIDPKTKELELAYPNEHLIDADVAHGNTRNAFRDLPDEAKAAAQSRADEAKASLESQKAQ